MTTYTFQKVTYNGVRGALAKRFIYGAYDRMSFGKTRKAAIAAFDA
jgi:hypothetical protein